MSLGVHAPRLYSPEETATGAVGAPVFPHSEK